MTKFKENARQHPYYIVDVIYNYAYIHESSPMALFNTLKKAQRYVEKVDAGDEMVVYECYMNEEIEQRLTNKTYTWRNGKWTAS